MEEHELKENNNKKTTLTSIENGEANKPAAHNGKPHGNKLDADEDEEPEYLDEQVTGPMKYIEDAQEALSKLIKRHEKLLVRLILLALLIAYHVYLGFAIRHDWLKAQPLTIITCIIWPPLIYFLVLKPKFGDRVYFNLYQPMEQCLQPVFKNRIVSILCALAVAAGIAVFLIIDTRHDRKRLIGLAGMASFLLLMFIHWRPVILGYFLQFCLGLLVLRWPWGSKTFGKISDQIVKFLDYTNNGTVFVYGFLAEPPNICGMEGVFAFTALQVVVFFGSVVALLYYFGIMQFVLKKMAWFMQLTLGTTATESLNACACIFLGQSEAPLLIKPYLEKMTASELHAVMTSGFACIAGSLFAAYIAFGACPTYLLSATVMSAPGSLACSKILFPETEKSQLKRIEDLELPPGEESNALECISNGAVAAVELVMAIVANLIVFLALLAFIDSVIGYAGHLVGHEGWTFELAMGYVFFPFAYVMGVTGDSDQTLKVAQLMGTKTTLNEFIAYQKLGEYVRDHKLTPRSAMIATYALCGFSNFSSIGIQLGILGGMVPHRKPLLSSIALRALFAGCISCFWTACLAGILVENPTLCVMKNSGSTCFDPDKYQREHMSSTTFAPSLSSSPQAFFGKTEL